MICSVIGFALLVTSPATRLAGMILISMSHSEQLASLVFIGTSAIILVGFFFRPKRRPKRRPAPREVQQISQEQQISVHAFVSHVKMHPELLEGKTEFDLERFRKLWDGSSQMALADWIKQFGGATPTTSQIR